MGITFQKIAGAVLFALILAVGTGLLADGLLPTQPHVVEQAAAPEAGEGQPAAAGGGGEQPVGVLLAAADPQAGAGAVGKCKACHGFEEGGANKVGPNLYGIYGADIAAKEGFAYSEALAAKEGQWTAENLDAFLAKPADFAKGTKMVFAGISSGQERANVVAYLHSLTPGAAPLPTEQAAAPAAAQEGAPAQTQPAAQQPPPAAAAPQPAAAGGSAVAMVAAADPAAGQAAAKKCAACHTFDEGGPNRVGPNLHGIVGADIAAKEGFKYSDVLAAKEGAWTYEALDAFLKKPADFAKGTKMVFAGVGDDKERAALLAYLRSISPNAPPPPQG